MNNHYVVEYCLAHNFKVSTCKQNQNVSLIFDNQTPVGFYNKADNYVSFYTGKTYKKADLFLFLLEGIQAH